MNYLSAFIYYATLLLFVFLSVQSLYLFVFALAGRLISLKQYRHSSHLGSFVIYVSCYQEENVIEAAEAALALTYPGEKKQIVIITTTLQATTAKALSLLPVQVTEVNSISNISKVTALQAALRQTQGGFDYALFLDARHRCTKGFLYRINDVMQSGCPVVQGQRVVRYSSGSFALLDAISAGIDTHIFCKSHRLLGLSSAISSSGVAMRYSLCKEMVPCLTEAANFNTESELYLLRKRIHFGYAPKALLYEEKKDAWSGAEQKYHQWMLTQSHAIKAYLSDGFTELCKGNVDLLDKVFQTLLLPRVLMLGITPLAVLLSLVPGPALATNYWLYLWMVTYAAILMSVPAKHITNQFLKAVFLLPSLFLQITKLFFIQGNKNTKLMRTPYSDMHTQHG